MNRRNVLKWVKALESGKHRRCRYFGYCPSGKVSKKPRYCPLGLANKLCFDETGEWGWKRCAVLTSAAMRWLGVDSNNMLLGSYLATSLNDRFDLSFRDVARYIRKYMLGQKVSVKAPKDTLEF